MAKGRILVVEDESIVAMEIMDTLQHFGYAVSGLAASGVEAIQKASEARPDLVLMDIRLKGRVDGIEAAERIRVQLDIPIIFLTAYTDEKTLERARITEPFGYLIKPFEGRELHTTIEMAIYKHEMERKLKENERWLATTLRSIGEAVVATDCDGSVTFMNPAAVALTGREREDALGRHLTEILDFADEKTHAAVGNPVQHVLGEGIAVERQNSTLLVARDGREMPIDYNAAPLLDDGGAVCGAVLVFRDTTERKQMEQALLRSERLAAMGHLAAALTHEINNPLQAIANSLELILDFPLGEQEQQEYLRSIQQEIERLMGLTDRVLDFARPPAVKRRPISVCDVVRYALTLAGKQLESSRIKSDVRLPDTLPPVLASRDLLVQVLLNLIINAIEAMPDGGELTVSAQVIKDHIELSFADTGPGLSPDALDKVFEPFYTTKAEGIGLGLPISHSIIKCHGGAIVAGNTPDGAVFTVELPVARPMDSKQKNHG